MAFDVTHRALGFCIACFLSGKAELLFTEWPLWSRYSFGQCRGFCMLFALLLGDFFLVHK